MENELKKLRKSLRATQTLCILILVMFLALIVVMLQGLRIFLDYKNDIETTFAVVKQLKKADLPQLAEDIHNTSEAINAVDWDALSAQLNELDLQEIKTTIESLDLDQINSTLAQLDIDELTQTLNELDIDQINQTMEDLQSALEKFDKFGFF
ncbi:MAG: hypothetical protein IKI46_02260 [Lachnospiraceae bacterium]|nr:hypothetical protein [Lachnospiraceae bacterium]